MGDPYHGKRIHQPHQTSGHTTTDIIMRFLAVFLMVALVGGAQAWSLGSLWGLAEEELVRKERDVAADNVEHLEEDIEDDEDELEDDEEDDEDELEDDEDDEEDELEDEDEDDDDEDLEEDEDDEEEDDLEDDDEDDDDEDEE